MEDIAFGVLRTGRIRRVLIKLNKVHEVISEMARIIGMVKDDDLFDALRLDHGIRRLEAARLIELLVRDMAIYSPKPGYFKEGFEFP